MNLFLKITAGIKIADRDGLLLQIKFFYINYIFSGLKINPYQF